MNQAHAKGIHRVSRMWIVRIVKEQVSSTRGLWDTSGHEKPNSIYCPPVPLSLVIPLLLRLSCLGTSLSIRLSHTLHMLFYDSHAQTTPVVMAHGMEEQASVGFNSKGYAILGIQFNAIVTQ